MKWGLNIIGPLPQALVQKRFLLALTYYYSKWIIAEVFATIKDKDVKVLCGRV